MGGGFRRHYGLAGRVSWVKSVHAVECELEREFEDVVRRRDVDLTVRDVLSSLHATVLVFRDSPQWLYPAATRKTCLRLTCRVAST